MPQLDYALTTGSPGQLATAERGSIGSYLNPLVAEVWTVTIGGTPTDGVYSFRVRRSPADSGTVVTVTRSTTPSTNNDLAAALDAAGEALAALANLVDFDTTGAVITVTGIHVGQYFEITDATAPSPGTMTLANTVNVPGSTIQTGRAVILGSNDGELAGLASGSISRNVLGFTTNNANLLGNTGVVSDVDGWAPGATASVVRDAPIWVECETVAADGGQVYVRRIASASQKLGIVRNAGDGTPRVETVTPTAVNDQQYSLRIDVDATGNGDWESYVIAALGDGSATATEICDDYRTQLAAITALTGVITGSGTATLVLTGAAGVNFASVDLGPGVSAVVETTAGTFETIALRGCYFLNTITASGNVKIRPNQPAA